VPLIHWGGDSAQKNATLYTHNKQQPTADAAALLCSAFNNFVVFYLLLLHFVKLYIGVHTQLKRTHKAR